MHLIHKLVFITWTIAGWIALVKPASLGLKAAEDDKGPDFDLSRVFISVKTGRKFHSNRLPIILSTWYPRLAEFTYFITDQKPDDGQFIDGNGRPVPDDHVVVTQCGPDHSRADLVCKMEAELTEFYRKIDAEALSEENSGRHLSWFCHVDDDNYVSGRGLARVLSAYPDDDGEWYLGKASVSRPLNLHLLDGALHSSDTAVANLRRRTKSFWFATGGAGVCISRALAERMRPHVVDGGFRRLAAAIRMPDDVTLGYLVEVVLDGRLTEVDGFHSHLEALATIPRPEAEATLSYFLSPDLVAAGKGDQGEMESVANTIALDARTEADLEAESEDKTRFHALHCRIYPKDCP